MQDLRGKVAIITGASSGIGAATARAFAREGIAVALAARREDRLAEVATEVRRAGARAEVLRYDAGAPGAGAALLQEASARLGEPDVVFANAGYGVELDVVETSDEALRRLFEVNFFASVELLRAAASRMLAAGRGGHLLMCSSCVSRYAIPGHGAYSASKAAQAMVCQAMRHELREEGIEVSSVHPVATLTEFFDEQARQSGRSPTGEAPAHAPKMFIQPASRVAESIVRCLRRPRGEVWTSGLARVAGGVFALAPWTQDMAIRVWGQRGRH